VIYLKELLAATDADVLLNTRLTSIPYGGELTIQCQANLANATNRYAVTIQLPDGSVPVDAQVVAAGQEADALGGQLDTRYLDQWTFLATVGGHFIISFTETGTAVLTWRVVLRP